jgi:hypothetical protein
MKNYSTTMASIDSVLSDDLLYFEGIRRPTRISLIKDSPSISGDNLDILEKYFNDIHNLFLKKLSGFAISERTTDEESLKLQALLQELIKVKSLLVYNS